MSHRNSITHKAVIHGEDGRCKFFFTVELTEDGQPRALFLHMDQAGSTLDGMADTVGILFSKCLKAGVPLEELVEVLSYRQFQPAGMCEGTEVRSCRSVVDYVMQFLRKRFLTPAQKF